MARVTKAVIAAAGFGTRFLPQTKAMPKEMLPIIDKPIIQYIVEDLVAAGIKDIIIVGSSNKRAIEDHFDVPSEDLLNNLRAGGAKKQPYINEVQAIAELANFIYIRQKGPYGTATPILNAAHLLGDQPFIYAFADDLTVAKPNAYQQMIARYEEFQTGIVPCLKMSRPEEYNLYGVVSGSEVRPGVVEMDGIIEKPGIENAPSDLAAVGGYLLTSECLEYLEAGVRNLKPGEEFYVTSKVIDPMLRDGKRFHACEITNSKRYDTGDKLEYLKTVVDFGLTHKELGPQFQAYLRDKLILQ